MRDGEGDGEGSGGEVWEVNERSRLNAALGCKGPSRRRRLAAAAGQEGEAAQVIMTAGHRLRVGWGV